MGILKEFKDFDEAFEDGCYTSPSSDLSFLKEYDVGAMLRKASELNKQLTEEEIEQFRIKTNE